MALTNSQYEQLMRGYEQKRLDSEKRLQARYEKAITEIPELKEIDDSISRLSVEQARRLLGGDKTALSTLKKELRVLFHRKRKLLKTSGFPENYLERAYSCPDCKDTGYIGGTKCHCFQRAIIDLLYTQSHLKEILEKENFSSFSLAYYSRGHIDPLTGRSSLDAMKTALAECKAFAKAFPSKFQNLLLYGDTGVGKTFLSHCVAKELIERSFAVIYLTASQLFNIFARAAFDKDAEASLDYGHIYDCDFLIIDDLGTETSNSFSESQLFVCLNERILRQKSTLISTNLSPNDIKEIYSERIFSRITSNYTILRLTGDDIRIQKKLMDKI